jgi:hypothetical protein
MKCDDVRARLQPGLSDAAVLDHLETCEACAAIAEERGLFGGLVDEEELRDLYAGTEARIEMDRNFAGWLKSRPTWVRRAGAASVSIVVFSIGLLLIRRPDFEAYPRGRMILTIAAMGVLLTASLLVALRPLHRPRLPDWLHRGLATFGVAVAFLLAALPSSYVTPDQYLSDDPIKAYGLNCFVIGLLLGIPVYATARLFDRGANSFSAILAALAAGLTGNLALHVHCPRSDATHLLSGHFTVVIAFVAMAAVLVWIEARFQTKSVLKEPTWPRRS